MDLGSKNKSIREKNQALLLFAGAPLLLAQLGALEFRKKMMHGKFGGIKYNTFGYSYVSG